MYVIQDGTKKEVDIQNAINSRGRKHTFIRMTEPIKSEFEVEYLGDSGGRPKGEYELDSDGDIIWHHHPKHLR